MAKSAFCCSGVIASTRARKRLLCSMSDMAVFRKNEGLVRISGLMSIDINSKSARDVTGTHTCNQPCSIGFRPFGKMHRQTLMGRFSVAELKI